MSYKFDLNHTLAIADIHDMITIDIKPETRCAVAGGDVEIHGYLTFRGSYLTSELGEAPFEGSVPLDITLPYLGGAPDIKPEVVSFDYRVDNKKSLTLNLEVALAGYGESTRDTVMDAWIDPIVDEPVYEQAVIEPFDLATTHTLEDTPPSEEDESRHDDEIILTEQILEIEPATSRVNFEETHQDEASLDVAVEIHEEEIPYSPLVEIKEPEITTRIDSIVAPIVESPVDEVIATEKELPRMSESASALMDELFALKRGTAFKEQMHQEVEPEVEVIEQAVREIEETEAVVVETEFATLEMSDSVARQFADGNTTIKMIYVEDEMDTLGGVLERFEATLDDVWNLEALADGVSVGDCVMLRYEKTI